MEPVRQTQVQSVLLSKIHPNPNQPRHVITPEMVESMAASLKSAGIKNPVKLRPMPDGQFEIISGHIRAAGARKLDWETLPALVLDLTPEQALLESILDNRGQEMTWLDLYQSIESLQKVNPNLTQQELGDRLEVDRSVISRAIKLLSFLTESSRKLICENLTKLDGYQVSENAVYRLTDLKTPETVEKALQVVLDRHMTEPQAAKLAAWVLQTGKEPQEYPSQPGKKGKEQELDPSDPNAHYWKPLPSYVQVRKTPQGYRVVMDLMPSEGPVAVYGAMAWLESLKADAEGATPDMQYNDAYTQLVEEAKKRFAEESRLQKAAEEQAEAQKATTEKAKAEAKKAATALKEFHKTQAQKQAQVALGDFKGIVRANIESNLGKGTLSDMVFKAAEGGQKAKALKLYADGLAHLGKTEADQKPALGMFEGFFAQWADLRRQSAVRNSQPTVEAQGPNPEAGINQSKDEASNAGSVLGQVVEAAKDKLNMTPQSITDALVNDAKKAANYEIRKDMRDVLKDVF